MRAVLLVAFVVAEVLAAAVAVPAGAAVHAAVLVLALNCFLLTGELEGEREGEGEDRSPAFFAVMALLSAMRLVTMALPAGESSLALRALAVGAPVLVAAVLLVRRLGTGPAPARRRAHHLVHVGAAVAGLPLGIAAARVQHLHAPRFSHPVAGYVATGVAVALFAAVTEELVFRRLLVPAARAAWGSHRAILASTVAFAATYLGTHSLALLGVVGLTGLLFGWTTERTGSAVGPAIGHAVAAVGALLVWPGLLPR